MFTNFLKKIQTSVVFLFSTLAAFLGVVGDISRKLFIINNLCRIIILNTFVIASTLDIKRQGFLKVRSNLLYIIFLFDYRVVLMPTKHLLVVTYVLSGIWWLSPTISAAEILEGPFTFQGHNKSDDVAVKCQKGKTSFGMFCNIVQFWRKKFITSSKLYIRQEWG